MKKLIVLVSLVVASLFGVIAPAEANVITRKALVLLKQPAKGLKMFGLGCFVAGSHVENAIDIRIVEEQMKEDVAALDKEVKAAEKVEAEKEAPAVEVAPVKVEGV